MKKSVWQWKNRALYSKKKCMVSVIILVVFLCVMKDFTVNADIFPVNEEAEQEVVYIDYLELIWDESIEKKHLDDELVSRYYEFKEASRIYDETYDDYRAYAWGATNDYMPVLGNYKLSADLKEFFVKDRSVYVENEKALVQYRYLTDVLNLYVLNKQAEYMASCAEAEELNLRIVRLMNAVGLRNADSLNDAEKSYNECCNEFLKISCNYEEIKRDLFEKTREEYKVLLLLDETDFVFGITENPTVIEENIKKKSNNYRQLEYNINKYNNYIEKYGEYLKKKKEYENTEMQARYTKRIYEDEKIALDIEIKKYVSSLVLGYDISYADYLTAEEGRKNAEASLKAEEAKGNAGRSTQKAIYNKKTALKASELKVAECVAKLIRMKFIYDNNIFGVDF